MGLCLGREAGAATVGGRRITANEPVMVIPSETSNPSLYHRIILSLRTSVMHYSCSHCIHMLILEQRASKERSEISGNLSKNEQRALWDPRRKRGRRYGATSHVRKIQTVWDARRARELFPKAEVWSLARGCAKVPKYSTSTSNAPSHRAKNTMQDRVGHSTWGIRKFGGFGGKGGKDSAAGERESKGRGRRRGSGRDGIGKTGRRYAFLRCFRRIVVKGWMDDLTAARAGRGDDQKEGCDSICAR